MPVFSESQWPHVRDISSLQTRMPARQLETAKRAKCLMLLLLNNCCDAYASLEITRAPKFDRRHLVLLVKLKLAQWQRRIGCQK